MNSENHKYTNALINETSPYLLQHAHNPVDWYPWNEETLEKAKKEDKLLIISVGYAACHWCHVMEHESFEDSLVAKIMNDNFICIKVDREERPDIDNVYMTACQLVRNIGCGWPLNAFALPDGRPVWAATYFPKDKWMEILNQFIDLKEKEPERLEKSAQQITDGIKSIDNIDLVASKSEYPAATLNDVSAKIFNNIDFTNGGTKGAPKFPMPNIYEYLLQYYSMTKDNKALEVVELTLDKMANGGIYDQLGGGFARYSTDEYWLAPHFEKMLYDNSQMISLYAHAYQVLKKPHYKKVIEQTLEFIERELLDKSNGYYASIDADSEGEEGKFYVWQEDEIATVITNEDELKLFKDYYSIKKYGNWEHTNILMINEKFKPKSYNLPEEEILQIIEKNRELLLKSRENRIRPGTDDKVLTSWNGLMLKGYVDAYKALGKESILTRAQENASFILQHSLQEDGSLNRNFKNGKSNINAFLDDYATVIDAFIGMYEITFDNKYLDKSKILVDHVNDHFKDDKSKMFYYTSDLDAQLIVRKTETTDKEIPASNSMMAKNLYKLGTLLYDEKLISQSKQMLSNMWPQIENSNFPGQYSNWCQLYASMVNPPYEIAILGEDSQSKAKAMQKHYFANALFLGGKTEGNLKLLEDKLQKGRTMIYVCQNKVCKLPVEDVDKALALIE